jgi:hypothetical protein
VRLLLDSFLALTVVACLAGAVWYVRTDHMDERNVDMAQESVRRIQREIYLQAQLGQVELTDKGIPTSIDPHWFGDDLPRNPLLDDNRPWLSVAGDAERGFVHPRDLTADSEGRAAFWYNPDTGIVRARVPQTLSDEQIVRRYNRVNDCSLKTIFDSRTETQSN